MKHGGPQYEEVMRLLKEHGAVLERTKKHAVWRFPDGRSFALPTSPSRSSSWDNNLHDLRKLLGVNGERGAIGGRRPRKVRRKVTVKTSIEPQNNIQLRDLKSQLFQIRHKLPPYWTPTFWQFPTVWERTKRWIG